MNAIVAFGPSLMDISSRLSPLQFESCVAFGLQPGEWRRLSDYSDVLQIISILSNRSMVSAQAILEDHGNGAVAIVAGSTTLGMLSAMPKNLRSAATYASAVANVGPLLDPFSQRFSDAVVGLGVYHARFPHDGYNPIGFVLNGPDEPEKMLAMFPGVSRSCSGWILPEPRARFAIIDSYELNEDEFGWYLKGYIEAGTSKICLSLGNVSVLDPPRVDLIRHYLSNGYIYSLCGNSDEYMKLFPEIHPYFSHRLGFANHPIATLVPYALMTFGIEGMAAHWKGRYVYAPAVELDPDLIVNTSGAGDTAAGGFVAGIVEKRDPVEVLASCTSLASDVLRTHSSRLLQSPDPGK